MYNLSANCANYAKFETHWLTTTDIIMQRIEYHEDKPQSRESFCDFLRYRYTIIILTNRRMNSTELIVNVECSLRSELFPTDHRNCLRKHCNVVAIARHNASIHV